MPAIHQRGLLVYNGNTNSNLEREPQMTKDQYILVAESAFAKIFKTGKQNSELSLVHTIENPEGRKQRRELDADRQGLKTSVYAGNQGMRGDENSHDHDVDNYARDICELLQKEHHEGKFATLQIAAAPHLLGMLRKHLGNELEKAVSKTVNKDLTHANEREILATFE
jgi:protein required for attachment to host cells